MHFHILHDDRSGQMSYLLADTGSRQAVLIDPRSTDLPLLQALLSEHDWQLRWVLRTHHHDTDSTERAALARLGAPLVQGDGASGTQRATHGDVLPLGREPLRVLATPGHTLGCLSFAWRDRLFCGGLLAVDACPHQPYPAAPEALWDSVTQGVFLLPLETLLFAGHEHRARAVSTVLEQRLWHPLFAGQSRDAFLARAAALRVAAPTGPL